MLLLLTFQFNVLVVIVVWLEYFINKASLPFRYNTSASCTYECGFIPHKPPATYSLGFYSVGLSQFILDSELVFVYPFIPVLAVGFYITNLSKIIGAAKNILVVSQHR